LAVKEGGLRTISDDCRSKKKEVVARGMERHRGGIQKAHALQQSTRTRLRDRKKRKRLVAKGEDSLKWGERKKKNPHNGKGPPSRRFRPRREYQGKGSLWGTWRFVVSPIGKRKRGGCRSGKGKLSVSRLNPGGQREKRIIFRKRGRKKPPWGK